MRYMRTAWLHACSVPEMFAFPVLQDIFTTIADKSNFTLHTSRAIARVQRNAPANSGGGRSAVAPEPGGGGSSGALAGKGSIIIVMDAAGVSERFDEIVFACNAEQVIKSLDDISW